MSAKCQHPEVVEKTRYTPATRWEPAEYEVRYICTECGAVLDASDLEGDETIVKE